MHMLTADALAQLSKGHMRGNNPVSKPAINSNMSHHTGNEVGRQHRKDEENNMEARQEDKNGWTEPQKKNIREHRTSDTATWTVELLDNKIDFIINMNLSR